MKISTRGRYALRLMVAIAADDSEGYTTLRQVSENQAISIKYLEQLVGRLTKAGLLSGHRGIHGGYSLTRDPKDITAGDILRASEGSVAPVACLEGDCVSCVREPYCATIDFWRGMDSIIADYIDGVTLASLVERFETLPAPDGPLPPANC